ncbi:hypothetical protein HDU67_004989 [Dinochytrium kinnereticum]|nr:hypothetical protein HDU67_004989 [Dinochytrium kinnereticum]
MTSETFLWLLYLRFTAVTPIKNRILRALVLIWMILESAAIFSIWIVWVVGAEKKNSLRNKARIAYSFASVVQACTALFLSGYFVLFFFFPRLKGLQSKTLFITFFTSGLMYLIIETSLQFAFTLFMKLDETRDFYTGLNQLCTSLRHGIFLLFIHAIRDASASAERDRDHRKLAKRAAEHLGRGFYGKAALAAGVVGGGGGRGGLEGAKKETGRLSWASDLTDDEARHPSTLDPFTTTKGSPSRPNSFLTDGGEGDDVASPPSHHHHHHHRYVGRPSTESSRSTVPPLTGSSGVTAVTRYPPAVYTFKPPPPATSPSPSSGGSLESTRGRRTGDGREVGRGRVESFGQTRVW